MKRYPSKRTVGLVAPSVVLFLILWSAPLFGGFRLERIAVKCNGKTTLATITTDGVVSYNHFKLEDGHLRVVVDLEQTLNPAGVGEYVEIPGASLTSIRTSQFSEAPLVTRIVFDLQEGLEYRAQQQGESIKLIFSTPGENAFPDFTVFQAQGSAPQKSERTVAALTPKADPEREENPGRKDPPAATEETEAQTGQSTETGEFQLTGISIESDGNTTFAIIKTEGVAPFKHFTLEGRRFLVAVDLEKTRNPAGLSSYEELPSTKLISIRTSQFSHEPLVSRVVFDFPREVEYQVEQKGQEIKLSFSTAGEKAFSSFSVLPAERKVVRESVPEELVVVQTKTSEPVKTPASPDPAPKSGVGEKRILPVRERVEYNPTKARDPFASLVGRHNPGGGLAVSDLPPCESLKLVGIVNEGSHFKALCESGHGIGYILGEGDRLKDGYVASVQADRVVLVIQQYGWSHRQVLALPTFGQ